MSARTEKMEDANMRLPTEGEVIGVCSSYLTVRSCQTKERQVSLHDFATLCELLMADGPVTARHVTELHPSMPRASFARSARRLSDKGYVLRDPPQLSTHEKRLSLTPRGRTFANALVHLTSLRLNGEASPESRLRVEYVAAAVPSVMSQYSHLVLLTMTYDDRVAVTGRDLGRILRLSRPTIHLATDILYRQGLIATMSMRASDGKTLPHHMPTLMGRIEVRDMLSELMRNYPREDGERTDDECFVAMPAHRRIPK